MDNGTSVGRLFALYLTKLEAKLGRLNLKGLTNQEILALKEGKETLEAVLEDLDSTAEAGRLKAIEDLSENFGNYTHELLMYEPHKRDPFLTLNRGMHPRVIGEVRNHGYNAIFEERPEDVDDFSARIYGKDHRHYYFLKMFYYQPEGLSGNRDKVEYTVLIPNQEAKKLVPMIREDPAILINVFRNVFKGYDRSNNLLRINLEKSKIDYNGRK